MAEYRSSRSVVVGALRWAVVDGDSWLFRSYAVVAGLLGVFVGTMFVLALPVWVIEAGGSALQRIGLGLLWLIGLALLAVLVLPMLLAARRRERGRPERQVAFGIAGYAYVGSLYLALLASAPPDLRDPARGPFAPVLEALYAMPAVSGAIFPIAGVVAILLVEYALDRSDRPGGEPEGG